MIEILPLVGLLVDKLIHFVSFVELPLYYLLCKPETKVQLKFVCVFVVIFIYRNVKLWTKNAVMKVVHDLILNLTLSL